MSKILFILAIFFFKINILFAQQHDRVWIFGYSSANKPDYPNNGTTFLTFEKDSVRVEPKWIDIDFNEANTSFCDSLGNFLFTTNMFKVVGKDGKFVKNGDTLSFKKGWYNSGSRAGQGVLALPFPNNNNKTALIYGTDVVLYFNPIQYSVFDASIGVNGTIVQKNTVLIKDSVSTGKITGVKHGNGRDWWIHIGKEGDIHYLLLLTPKGIHLHSKQKIGTKIGNNVGQAVHSPDGKKFVEVNNKDGKLGKDIMIYDFDRCTGVLSNAIRIHFDSFSVAGCAISPNSKFLYFANGLKIYQYDLEASDIKATETVVAVWDGFIDFSYTAFNFMQLGPDGKIYVNTNGSTHYLHTIEKPNEKGLACNVKQRSIKLFNYNSWSIPNHPNYRLGALKGSPCDTLGLGVTTKDIEKEEIKIFPNPAAESITIQCEKNTDYQLIIRNITGQVLKQESILNGNATIDTSDLQNGMIICELWAENQRVATEKIIIIH